jgi:hypothetical protein
MFDIDIDIDAEVADGRMAASDQGQSLPSPSVKVLSYRKLPIGLVKSNDQQCAPTSVGERVD